MKSDYTKVCQPPPTCLLLITNKLLGTKQYTLFDETHFDEAGPRHLRSDPQPACTCFWLRVVFFAAIQICDFCNQERGEHLAFLHVNELLYFETYLVTPL